MNDDSTREPWEQWTDHDGPLGPEDDEWFARFLHYLNQPHPRSFRTTYEAFGRGNDADPYKVSASWRSRIGEYQWAERAAARDKAEQLARRQRHLTTSDDVWDELYGGAFKAAKTLVGYATDRRSFGKNPQQDKIRLQAATEVLDRLGFGKRPARPIYAESAEGADRPLVVQLVNMDPAALNQLAAWDDDDDGSDDV